MEKLTIYERRPENIIHKDQLCRPQIIIRIYGKNIPNGKVKSILILGIMFWEFNKIDLMLS